VQETVSEKELVDNDPDFWGRVKNIFWDWELMEDREG